MKKTVLNNLTIKFIICIIIFILCFSCFGLGVKLCDKYCEHKKKVINIPKKNNIITSIEENYFYIDKRNYPLINNKKWKKINYLIECSKCYDIAFFITDYIKSTIPKSNQIFLIDGTKPFKNSKIICSSCGKGLYSNDLKKIYEVKFLDNFKKNDDSVMKEPVIGKYND